MLIHEKEKATVTLSDRIDEEVRVLKTLRDEVRVQAHLGKAEAKEAFENVEKKFFQLEGKLKVLGEASRESAAEIAEATRLLAHEVRDGYARVRELL